MPDDDETKLVKTLAPHEFPSQPPQLAFDWRIELTEQLRALVKRKVLNAVGSEFDATAEPDLVIISRSDISTADKLIQAEIRDASGAKLGVLRITDNGAGKVYLSRKP